MHRFHSFKLVLIAALGALALGSLASLALAKDGNHHRSEKRHHGHHHRHHHGGTAGTIASFDTTTGRLTISLLDGETVSGLVDRGTRIKCEDEHSPDITHLRRGEEEPGDDHDDGDGSSHSGRGPSGHDDNGTGANCTTSDLIPGAVVQHADLEIEHGSATFDEVELDD